MQLSIEDLSKISTALLSRVPVTKDVLDRLHGYIEHREYLKEAADQEEERRKRAIPEVVPDWKNVRLGTKVVRSKQWKQNKCEPKNTQIGLLVQLHYFKDDLCGVVTWPIIHWENELHSSLNHPANAALSSGESLPKITMNANQQEENAGDTAADNQ